MNHFFIFEAINR